MLVSRDPFARQELHRATVTPYHKSGCDWCGQTRKGGKLFRYSYESDGGRKFATKGEFCSVSCFRSYHCIGE